jgi:hypothetical protein
MKITSRFLISIALCFQWKSFSYAISAPRLAVGISSSDPRRKANSQYINSRGGTAAVVSKPTKTMPGTQMQILK